MEWKVILYSNDGVKIYNIFDNGPFSEGIDELFQQPELTRQQFSHEVRKLAQWQFWSRSEYECVISGCPYSEKNRSFKLDVFSQLDANWDRFIEYMYNCYCWQDLFNYNIKCT